MAVVSDHAVDPREPLWHALEEYKLSLGSERALVNNLKHSTQLGEDNSCIDSSRSGCDDHMMGSIG